MEAAVQKGGTFPCTGVLKHVMRHLLYASATVWALLILGNPDGAPIDEPDAVDLADRRPVPERLSTEAGSTSGWFGEQALVSEAFNRMDLKYRNSKTVQLSS